MNDEQANCQRAVVVNVQAEWAKVLQAHIDRVLPEAREHPDLRPLPVGWANLGCIHVVVGYDQAGRWLAVATIDNVAPEAWKLARWIEDRVGPEYPFAVEVVTEW